MLKMKGMRFPKEIILLCVRSYAGYPLSYRNLEEMMHERGVYVDHSSVSRWAIKFLPLLEKVFRKHKRAVGTSWRMDETYIKVNGQWKGSVALPADECASRRSGCQFLKLDGFLLPTHKIDRQKTTRYCL